MIELIFIISTALFGLLLVGIGSKLSWSANEIVELSSYCFIGLGCGVIFYALIWIVRWLLLGGLVT